MHAQHKVTFFKSVLSRHFLIMQDKMCYANMFMTKICSVFLRSVIINALTEIHRGSSSDQTLQSDARLTRSEAVSHAILTIYI